MYKESKNDKIKKKNIQMIDNLTEIKDFLHKDRTRDDVENLNKEDLRKVKKELVAFADRDRKIRNQARKKKVKLKKIENSHSLMINQKDLLEKQLKEQEAELIEFNRFLHKAINTPGLDKNGLSDLSNLRVNIAREYTCHMSHVITPNSTLSSLVLVHLALPKSLKHYLSLVQEYVATSKQFNNIETSIIGAYSTKLPNLTQDDLSYLLIAPSVRESIESDIAKVNYFLKGA